MKNNIGNRFKDNYEKRNRQFLLRRTPVIIRVDGRCFHSYCKDLRKPFDQFYINCMNLAALEVAKDMQGCEAFYHQSDEVTFFLRDYRSHQSDAWFNYNQSKMESVSASLMTGWFNYFIERDKLAFFDSRAFNVPREEVINCFLWRVRDWHMNSITMYAQSHFSHKELHGKTRNERVDMLYDKGFDWYGLDHRLKYGSLWIYQGSNKFEKVQFEPVYASLESHLKKFLVDGD